MSTATAVVIGVSIVFFAGMGLFALAAPRLILKPFGINVDQPTARAEVRAVYGGFGLAIAAVLGYAMGAPEAVRTGITLAVAVALAGMAFGRLWSAVVDQRTSFYPNWFYCLVELAGAAALYWAR